MHERRTRGLTAAALVLALLLAVPLFSPQQAPAVVSTTITVDGSMADWAPVFMDSANTISDRSGADDPDNPTSPSRDLVQAAYTWDATNLYIYARRTTTGGPSMTYHAYLDLNGNGYLDNQDMVFDMGSGGGTPTLYRYVPASAGGTDTMGGDGVRVPGTEGAAVTGAMASAVAANGIEIEARVAWAALGKPAGSPIGLHFACGLNSPVPGSVTDNTGNLTSRYRGVTVVPDNDSGARAGTLVTYSHTITNGGNGTDTFDLTANSSQGWATTIKNGGGIQISSVTLKAGESTSVIVSLQIPPTAPDSARDVTLLTAVCRADLNVTSQAKDETMVGLITVSPYRQGAMAQSGVISYAHTLSNNTTAAQVIDLSAISSHGWTIGVYDATGSTPLGSILLSAGATATIVCKITVPVGTPIGTTDVGTVKAALASDPSEQGLAYDEVTVQKEVSIAPNNAGPGGSGTMVSYTHTVMSSWSTTRTINLTATSSRGWTVNIYDRDAITKITSVTLSPFGGSRTIYIRITIPAGTASGVVDTTSVKAIFGAVTDTATDVTTVSKLALYDSPGYSVPTTTFEPGDTVYARGMGLTSGAQVRFRWLDPSGATAFQSALIGVDVTQITASSYTLAAGAANGTWTCVLLDSAGAEIARVPFSVSVPQFLTLSLDVPSLDFGTLDPATPAVPQVVGVTVNSSAPYQITPALGGQAAQMGLSVAGTANGLKPKGTGYFFDSYQVNIPWTTAPAVPLNAQVTYTAVQQ